MSERMKPPADTSWLLLDGHGWVRRAADKEPDHVCSPPMREVTYQLPAIPPPAKGWQGNEPPEPGSFTQTEVDGDYGDLWRCHCGRLWRVGDDCDYGPHRGLPCPRGGYHPQAYRWRPATWWQRIRYRGRP